MDLHQSISGHSLTLEERVHLKISLIEVKLNEDFNVVELWGKIFGIQKDYLIVCATKISHQIDKKYFFSIDKGLSFSQLPIFEPWMESKCTHVASLFMGSPSYMYDDKKKANDENKEEEEVDNEIENKDENVDPNAGDEPPPIEHTLTELDRLVWTINKMNEECQIVPQNAICLTSQKIMEKNLYFKGLSIHQATKLSSYLHFRNPKDPYAISNFRKIGASNNSDFLDPIINDLPHGCWILKSYKTGLLIKMRNLLWPGFEFFYEAGSTNYQQGYFGYGIRRNDLVFLL